MREDGGELPLGLDSDSQGLVGNAPSVVVPDAGGQELIKDVSQVSMAATKAEDGLERSGRRHGDHANGGNAGPGAVGL